MASRYYQRLRAVAKEKFGVPPGQFSTILVVAALSCAVGAGVAPHPSHAARLDYFALFGEWSVICWMDEAAGERMCAMEAPPLDPNRPRSAIELRRGEAGEVEIAVRRRETANPATPVFVRIDDNPPHRATPVPAGEVIWNSLESTQIIEELKKGEEMVLRSFTGNDNRPRDEFISLTGFSKAWEAYRLQSEQPLPSGGGADTQN